MKQYDLVWFIDIGKGILPILRKTPEFQARDRESLVAHTFEEGGRTLVILLNRISNKNGNFFQVLFGDKVGYVLWEQIKKIESAELQWLTSEEPNEQEYPSNNQEN